MLLRRTYFCAYNNHEPRKGLELMKVTPIPQL